MTAYLPITAMWWYPDAGKDGPRRVIAPAGLPVHSVVAGRVTLVDAQAVGTVVVRDDHERFHHYRRLQASSITVQLRDRVVDGMVLGVIARPSDGSMPALLYGVHDADEHWIDTDPLLLGAADPAELGIVVTARERNEPMIATATAPSMSSSRSAPTLPTASQGPTGREPGAEAPAEGHTKGPDRPVRSRLAARRPPRRSS